MVRQTGTLCPEVFKKKLNSRNDNYAAFPEVRKSSVHLIELFWITKGCFENQEIFATMHLFCEN